MKEEADPLQVFTVSFFKTATGEVHGVQYTHENITAGVTATRALLPTSGPISPMDTVISAHSLSSGYGRVIAYTALLEGASFATVSSTKLYGPEDGMEDSLLWKFELTILQILVSTWMI